jgi:hypothetical protein
MIQRRSGTVINIGSALGLITLPFTGGARHPKCPLSPFQLLRRLKPSANCVQCASEHNLEGM